MEQKIIFSRNLQTELTTAVSECEHDRIFVLTDTQTARHCLPVIKDYLCLKDAQIITIGDTDAHKDLESLTQVWSALQKGGATRHSCLINLGGGMVTDLGGFAASTFKRGIDFINIPTTLLAMVDASVGGKTGINYGGLKNEIGVFNEAKYVILSTTFLRTLDTENLRAGYAEMLKHGLISSKRMWAELVNYDLQGQDLNRLQEMLQDSVLVKEHVVTEDPYEKGLRKALNLGHTFGHALESWSLSRASQASSMKGEQEGGMLHGYAVAHGLVGELYLSAVKTGFPTDKLRQTTQFIREHYGRPAFTCDDYEELIRLMHHDKKNTAGIVNFTLLGEIGDIRINQTATEEEIKEALDFIREG